MSILDRLNIGIKNFAARPKQKERTDHRDQPNAGYNPRSLSNKPSPAAQKALDARRRQEQAWVKRDKARRQRSLEKHQELWTYLATLKAIRTDTAIIYDGVLDIDVHSLIEDLKLQCLPDAAKHVALDATKTFVSDVHKHHYGCDNGDEIPWDLPEGITYTTTEAKNALWPNGISYNFQDDDAAAGPIARYFKDKFLPKG